MKRPGYLYPLFLSFILFFSCSKSNEEDLTENPGGNTCVTANMRYSTHIQPILQSNCYGCHGNGQVNGGVTLDSHAGVKAVADNGRLVGAITHASGFSPMPQGAAKLSECNINRIKAWIQDGAPNN